LRTQRDPPKSFGNYSEKNFIGEQTDED
jgi:hypothetical protein